MVLVEYDYPSDFPDYLKATLNFHINTIKQSMEYVHPSTILEKKYRKQQYHEKIILLTIGKNAARHAYEMERVIGDNIEAYFVHQIQGYASINSEHHKNWNYNELSHPFPTEQTFKRTKNTIREINKLPSEYALHIIISGGASAAFAIPEEEISPTTYIELVKRCQAQGFAIEELNYLRSLIDKVKGGKLPASLRPRPLEGSIFSDVVTDDPRIIGSGPISPGIKQTEAINEWLEKAFTSLNLAEVLSTLKMKLRKSKDHPLYLSGEQMVTVLAKREMLVSTILKNIEQNQWQAKLISKNVSEDVTNFSRRIKHELVSNLETGITLIWAGEPTIEVDPDVLDTGKGGRVAAMGCLVADLIKDYSNVIFLGVATDGKDGSSPRAGCYITNMTSQHLRPLGGAHTILAKGNSGFVLNLLKYGIDIQNTDLNFMDLYLLIVI